MKGEQMCFIADKTGCKLEGEVGACGGYDAW